MLKKIIIIIAFAILFLPAVISRPAFGETQAVEYLCELGITFYRQGRYDDALIEFHKALMLDPANATAQAYTNSIFEKETPVREKPTPLSAKIIEESPRKLTREEAINQTLLSLSKEAEKPKEEPVKPEYEMADVKVSGEVQLRLGVTSQDTHWRRANWDLNEKNYRVRSDTALDRRENTYDPRIYDRLKVKLDTGEKDGLGFHGNITVDPWSFTGKSHKTTVHSNFGDSADLELKYWANTGYSINETINTSQLGNSFALPEIKVDNEGTDAFDKKGAFTPNDTFHIPGMKIYRQFQPVRELWFDYKQDNLKLRVYPIAYENQSTTFDDPLKLSNNHIWWEDSPWIHSWKPGIYNSGASPVDFTKGYWDNTLSFFARDSEGQRLTSLRGFSFAFSPQEETSLTTNVAAPKDPWQDYSEVDNFLTATRLKHSLAEDLDFGLTATSRFGYNLERGNKLDAWNYVLGLDLGYEVMDGIKTSFEVARSQAKYDATNSQYETEAVGNAYYFSILGRFPLKSIMDTEYGYYGIAPEKYESSFTKFRFFVSRLDGSFDEPLSSYVETRDDEYWSRHLHFRKPFKYYYQGEGKLLSWEDVLPYRIGNGIDIGRNTVGFRIESFLWDKKIDNLFDLRNVHDTNGKFLENVSREELTVQVDDKLTTKLLGIYQRMPKTKTGTDPFVFNPRNRHFYDNTYIEDGKDPSLRTGSLGLEYEFFDWLSLSGIWEHTNDISLGYDNFPRGILNDGDRSLLSYQNGNVYRDVRNFLTDQQIFPRPPYPFYNIFKTGLRLNPMENLEVYLDYTRNEYEKAGQVDDNMNHVGLEVAYSPIPKLSLFFKYHYSRWQELDSLVQGITKVSGHHNLFTELIYRKSEDEDFTFQYGEASRDPYMGGVLDIGWDPYGGSLRTIDTQQIFRLYYRRKF